MAQIKRKKVSNKAVRGQKKENTLLKSKKFWIILSSIALGVAIIAVTITLVVLFTTKNTAKENPDYFGDSSKYLDIYKDKTNNEAVKFKKISYDGLKMHTDTDDNMVYVEYAFVFATDLTTFYVDDTINTGKEETDASYIKKDVIESNKKLFAQLAFLQYQIDQYNKSEEKIASIGDKNVEFYIVDTSKADNLGVLSDTNYGGSDDNSVSVTFFLYSFDELKKYSDTDEQKPIFGTNVTLITNTCINNAAIFMSRNFELEENK